MTVDTTRSIQGRGFDEPSGDDKWILIQKKTFQNWVNEQLKESGNRIKDLEVDLADGTKLVSLLEALTAESGSKWKAQLGTLNVRRKAASRIHQMETVEFALNIMKAERVDLTNIGASDIVDGNLKLILGLMWKLVLKYQIEAGKSQSKALRKRLLDLFNTILPDLGGLRNFSSDWNSGIAICALCNYCDTGLFADWRDLNPNRRLANCQQAISQAESKFRVPQVLTPENMCSPDLDDQSGMTYVSYFTKEDGPLHAALLRWVNSKIPDQKIRNFSTNWRNGVALCALNNALSPGLFSQYHALDPKDALSNCRKGSELGQKLGVEPYLTPAELSVEQPDTLSVMTHIARYQHAKPVAPPAKTLAPVPAAAPVAQARRSREVTEEEVVQVKRTAQANQLQSGVSFERLVNQPDSPTSINQSQRSPVSPNEMAMPAPRQFADDMSNQGVSSDYVDAGSVASASLEIEHGNLHKAPDGSGSSAIPVNTQVSYSLNLPKSISLKDVAVSIDTPSREKQRAPVTSLTQATPTKAQIAFTPTEPGKHSITCQIRNTPVKGSPMALLVLPEIGHISLQEIDSVPVNSKAEFTVNTVTDLGDLIKARVSQPDNKAVQVQSFKDIPSSQRFTFVPKVVGLHHVAVLYNGKNIKGSPFVCDVYNTDRVHIEGFQDSFMSQKLAFTIDTREAGAGEPEVRILHNHNPLKVDMLANRSTPGLYTGTFKPAGSGPHQAYVYFHNDLVTGRPLEFNVIPAGASVKCFGPGLQRGLEDVENSFTVDATKAFKAIDKLEVKAEGVNSLSKCTVKRTAANTFSVSYKPVEVGYYNIYVYADDLLLDGCPYKVRVTDPRRVECTKLYEAFMNKDGCVMLHPNKKFELSFDASLAGPGELKAKVTGPAGHVVPSNTKREEGDLYTLTFLPKVKGESPP